MRDSPAAAAIGSGDADGVVGPDGSGAGAVTAASGVDAHAERSDVSRMEPMSARRPRERSRTSVDRDRDGLGDGRGRLVDRGRVGRRPSVVD